MNFVDIDDAQTDAKMALAAEERRQEAQDWRTQMDQLRSELDRVQQEKDAHRETIVHLESGRQQVCRFQKSLTPPLWGLVPPYT